MVAASSTLFQITKQTAAAAAAAMVVVAVSSDYSLMSTHGRGQSCLKLILTTCQQDAKLCRCVT